MTSKKASGMPAGGLLLTQASAATPRPTKHKALVPIVQSPSDPADTAAVGVGSLRSTAQGSLLVEGVPSFKSGAAATKGPSRGLAGSAAAFLILQSRMLALIRYAVGSCLQCLS